MFQSILADGILYYVTYFLTKIIRRPEGGETLSINIQLGGPCFTNTVESLDLFLWLNFWHQSGSHGGQQFHDFGKVESIIRYHDY